MCLPFKNRYAALPDDQEGSYANYSFNAVGANDAEEAAKPPPTVKASFKEAPVAKPSVFDTQKASINCIHWSAVL